MFDLSEKSLLGRLAPEDRQQLLTLGTRRQFEAGGVLIRQGEVADMVYVLLDGFVKVTAISEEGHLVFLAVRSQGELVGEVGVLDGSPRPTTVTATGAVVALGVGGPPFLGFLARRPSAATVVTRSVTEKLRFSIRRRLEDVGSVRARLARVLLDLGARWGRPGPHGTEIAVGLNQGEIAALVGATERSVNEAFADFRSLGTLSIGYRRVVIHDWSGLRKAAGSTV
ncbi:Crp/Fnr family transcriptional regulator [Streptomyces sp. NPDC002130]|uniref:Crp/Fnr family transcriptional regulator n=1 Tax=Streptomyces sp. NPDC002130 TaxID=3155568 RepID=UPI00331DEE6F